MTTIQIKTQISAPVTVCFDMARDIDLHCRSCAHTKERAIAGTVSGVIGHGETVTFEGVHFGIKQRLTAKIVEFDPPRRFIDEMVQGAFKSLRHIHDFEEDGTGTVMSDNITYSCPFGPIGMLADALFVKRHLERLVIRRNKMLKDWAENGFDS